MRRQCSFIQQQGLKVVAILLSPRRRSHFDLDRLRQKDRRAAYAGTANERRAESFRGGREFPLRTSRYRFAPHMGATRRAAASISLRGWRGRSRSWGMRSFAGSMGGGGVSYADALLPTQRQIFTVPNEDGHLPGPRPLTRVGRGAETQSVLRAVDRSRGKSGM